MNNIVQQLSDHPFLERLSPAFLTQIAECACETEFPAGSQILAEGREATHFFLVRTGTAALQTVSPTKTIETFQTLSDGDFIGVSWLAPPYRLAFDTVAVTDIDAIAFDARCLRTKCDEDHDLGFALMQVFVPALIERLKLARIKALNLYAVETT